jgi:nicotinate-nucleotide adenylyltransferase
MKKVGILGGTFDPIHNGHISLAKAALKQLKLDEVLFMTGGMPPHKNNSNITPASMRHEMTSLALENENGLVPFDYEVNKKTYSYTAKTLKELTRLYPDRKIYFIIGEDSLRDILTWYKPQEIVKLCVLAVYPRGRKSELKQLVERMKSQLGGDIRTIDAPLYNISSTDIRRRVFEGKEIDKLVPAAVEKYIKDNGLYKMNDEQRKEKLKESLSNERYIHTQGVCSEAVKMAEKFGADKEKAYTSALLHDCAKCLDKKEEERLIIKYDVELDEMTKQCHPIVHAPLGAAVAQHEYGITDSEILNAIRFHTTAHPKMSLLEKIVFLADMIEPSRSYGGVDELRKLAETDIDAAFKEGLRQTLAHNLNKGAIIHTDTLEAWNWIIKEIRQL